MNVLQRPSELLTHLSRLLTPPRCPICGRVVRPAELCPLCRGKLNALQLGIVPPPPAALATVDVGWRYEAEVRHAIHQMKFSARPDQAENLMLARLSSPKTCTFVRGFAIIIAVPSRPKDLESRGYDVPLLLARTLSAHTGLPVARQVLRKVRDTKPQRTLSARQRRENLKGAFAVGVPEIIKGKRVLLVDDVWTTGSTLEECALTLCKAGAQEVGAFVLAHALAGEGNEKKEQ